MRYVKIGITVLLSTIALCFRADAEKFAFSEMLAAQTYIRRMKSADMSTSISCMGVSHSTVLLSCFDQMNLMAFTEQDYSYAPMWTGIVLSLHEMTK
jgi:hypothetical protein